MVPWLGLKVLAGRGLLIHQVFQVGPQLGYHRAEMSWVLDDNVLMNRALRRLGGTVSKRYRIYEKAL